MHMVDMRKILNFGNALTAMAAMIIVLMVSPVAAQSSEQSPVQLELNRMSASGQGCELTFVVQNKTRSALSSAAYEFVLFDSDGLVEKMTVFDFGTLENGKTVVRKFNLADLDCAAIGKILVNGPANCGGNEKTASACTAGFSVRSRTDLAFVK